MTKESTIKVEKHPSPDLRQAHFLAQVSRLPEVYENTAFKHIDKTSEQQKAEASNAVLISAPSNIPRDGLYILQRENITAVVVHDTKSNTATIALDPLFAGNSSFTSKDFQDSQNFVEISHPLGGKVHRGLYAKIADEPETGTPIIDRLQGLVYDLASRDPSKNLTVNFTGFSRGGAQTMITAGEMIARDMFSQKNIKMGDVYAFSPIGYGNQEFASALNKKVSDLGGRIWTIEIHGDTMPTVFTRDSSNFFTRYGYVHAGNHAYIIPAAKDKEAAILVNPIPELLKTLRAQPEPETSRHDTNYIIELLNGTLSQQMKQQQLQQQPKPPEQKNSQVAPN